jgi:MFS family permease
VAGGACATKAISIMQSGWALGYMLASISAGHHPGLAIARAEAWRWLFVLGVAPAFLTLWIAVRARARELDLEAPASGARPNPYAVIFGPGC